MPPENTQSNQLSIDKKRNIVVLIVVAIALVLISYLIMNLPVFESGQKDVVVNWTEDPNSLEGNDKLPAGFPEDIPVDTSEIEESYFAEYKERGITQYAVSYWSNESVSEVFSKYELFVASGNYVVESSEDLLGGKDIYAIRDGDDLSVKISTTNGRTFVQISYIKR